MVSDVAAVADPSTGVTVYDTFHGDPGFEVFGGVDLNLTVGGMNPAAVEHMTEILGGPGRMVWMSTNDAEFVVLPGEAGELGIYPQHTPLITRLIAFYAA